MRFPWMRGETVITAEEFDGEVIKQFPVLEKACKKSGEKRHYVDCVCSFDIEATNIPVIKQAVMYVWQMALGNNYIIIGRTWTDFLSVLDVLKGSISKNTWIVFFVHNLSYEFQFLRGIYSFQNKEVFAVDKRQILRCDMLGCFEFRCSYYLSNYSLDKWSKVMQIQHQKQSSEDFDYSVQRFPWTRLKPQEYKYCAYDVMAVVECVQRTMEIEHDDLQSIPLTSTGFVRREVKWNMQELGRFYVKNIVPTFDLYQLLRDAFRGGNTHANRYYTGKTIEGVYSADRASAYPDAQCNCKFPTTKFIHALDNCNVPDLIKQGYAVICRMRMTGVRLANPYWGFPYLPIDKCICNRDRCLKDNGRILAAPELEIAVTDLDIKIIMREYTADSIEFRDVWFARYGMLPEPFTRAVKRWFSIKTELKGTDAENTVEYMHTKAKINSVYGMTAQNPLKEDIFFVNGMFVEKGKLWELTTDGERKGVGIIEEAYDPEGDYEELKPWLPYQWGVWT